MTTPEMVTDKQCHNAEGPLWHAQEQRLYWTDIPRGLMFRYDPASGETEQIYEGEAVGGFTFQADGSLLLFKERGAVQRWQGGRLTTVIEDIPDERETRFNDVIADPVGRVFCGTMPTKDRLGRLYRLDPDGSLHIVLEDIGISNGLGFTPDKKTMYYTDSTRLVIYRFDYDQATGEISNRRDFLRTPEGEGVPDGMTVDAEGYVWSARWDGNHLFRYNVRGEEVLRIPLPARKVSCVTFGGTDFSDIYISTAGGQDRANEGSGAGAIFRINLGIKGVPEFVSRIQV